MAATANRIGLKFAFHLPVSFQDTATSNLHENCSSPEKEWKSKSFSTKICQPTVPAPPPELPEEKPRGARSTMNIFGRPIVLKFAHT
jgi:hypothetical protein